MTRWMAAGLVLLMMGSAALGQQSEQQKLLSKRAAEADAYRKLAEAVYGIQLNGRTIVRDFVTESDEIRGTVDSFIKGIRLGTPTWYEDGSCEVPAEVTVAKVIETIREAHTRYYKGSDIKTSDIDTIAERIEKKILKVIGMGAPRAELPPNLPIGTAEALGLPPAGGPKPSTLALPEIWKKAGPQGRLMALQAARVDAQRRLAERIKGLRLAARTQVRDFVTESDEINTELNAELVGAEEVSAYLHNDELIAEVTLRVPTEQVISTIKKLYTRHYKGDDVKGTDIENEVKTVIKRDFEATGMGVPPERFIRQYAQAAQVNLPDWVGRMVEAEGSASDPDIATAQGKLKAARAAELDARRKLAERIAGLQIDAQTYVKDFVAREDALGTEVDAIMVDAAVGEPRFEVESVRITVTVPGMRVWSVVNDQLRRQNR